MAFEGEGHKVTTQLVRSHQQPHSLATTLLMIYRPSLIQASKQLLVSYSQWRLDMLT